jgi:hypothetical protein
MFQMRHCLQKLEVMSFELGVNENFRPKLKIQKNLELKTKKLKLGCSLC